MGPTKTGGVTWANTSFTSCSSKTTTSSRQIKTPSKITSLFHFLGSATEWKEKQIIRLMIGRLNIERNICKKWFHQHVLLLNLWNGILSTLIWRQAIWTMNVQFVKNELHQCIDFRNEPLSPNVLLLMFKKSIQLKMYKLMQASCPLSFNLKLEIKSK